MVRFLCLHPLVFLSVTVLSKSSTQFGASCEEQDEFSILQLAPTRATVDVEPPPPPQKPELVSLDGFPRGPTRAAVDVEPPPPQKPELVSLDGFPQGPLPAAE